MPRYFLLTLGLFISVLAVSGCEKPTAQDSFHVMFSSRPNLYDAGVYANGMEIGKIASTEMGAGGSVKIAVSIKDEFKDLMTDNAVFYASSGRLIRATVEGFGNALPMETPLLGFNSKLSLMLFKLKTVLGPSAAVAARQAGRLYNGM